MTTSHTQHAIELALKEGFVHDSKFYKSSDSLQKLHYFYGNLAIIEDSDGFRHRVRTSEMFMSPAFWQSIGKALFNDLNVMWLQNPKDMWHSFIDTLASGKTPDDFFATILPADK